MELYMQACAAVLLAVILILTLGSRGKDMGTLLAIGVCAMGALIALRYLEPVVNFLSRLEDVSGMDHTLLSVLMKAAGIGLISEIAALICNDSGNSSLGKTIQILGSAVILWLSVPLFSMLMELLQKILGEV